MSQFHALRVDDLRPETRDAVVMTLSVPEELADIFRFTQGQYLTLRSRIDGEEVRRSYSICAAVQDGLLRVGIKKVAGGVFSNWVADNVKPGQTIEVMPPAGSFFTPLVGARRRHYLAFAAGSGITPVFGILKTTLLAEPLSQFTLVYGNRASGSIMFREELEDLKNRFLGRLNLVHVLSREKQDIELFNGRIDRAKCDALFSRWIDVSEVDTAFICGPQSMMLEVAGALEAHGVDRRQIKFELFGVASAPTARPAQAPGAAPAGCRATVMLDGVARDIDIEPGGETVLDAGLRQGLELPFACKGGVCSTCRAMLVEGEVDMDANFALEDYEIARGYILTCQSYPVTDRVVVDYDQQ